MHILATLLCLAAAAPQLSTVSGRVVDEEGAPVPLAQVYLEPGIEGELLANVADANGRYRFEDIPPGGSGVFAKAKGYAFGGRHVTLAIGEDVTDLTLKLEKPGVLTGKAVDERGKPVGGARIPRVALLGEEKVSIPLAKLADKDLSTPVSDDRGQFSVPGLPDTQTVALKVQHPDFAQEGVAEVPVNGGDVRVTLQKGVLLAGRALSRGTSQPVANIMILVRNAHPPYDTSVATTNNLGTFTLRLKPGVYVYSGLGKAYRSAGSEKLTITGQSPEQNLTLRVAGTAKVSGKVQDALTGEPVAGARLLLSTEGNLAASVRTGPTGAFSLDTMAGENRVHLMSAPGYYTPEMNALRVRASDGQTVKLPEFWLAPIPVHALTVVDEDGAPVAGSVVQVLRPYQLGWHETDEEGRVSLQINSLDHGTSVIGLAEHPSRSAGALFAIGRGEARKAKVALLPLSTLEGRITSDKGKDLSGALVAGLFVEKAEADPITLWRTLSGQDGRFVWPAVVPGIAQHCLAQTGRKASGKSMIFVAESGEAKSVGNLVVRDGESAPSMLGKKLPLADLPHVAGPPVDPGRPAVLVFCLGNEAGAMLEALENAGNTMAGQDIQFAAAVDESWRQGETLPALAIVRAEAPPAATTYVLDTDGRVIFETFGLPPLTALRMVRGAVAERAGE